MKKLFTLLFFSICNIIYSQKTFYVAASNGLNLRDAAGINGNKLELIPYGTALVPAEANDEGWFPTYNPTILDGYKAEWMKVKYNNKTGYVFMGYTTPVEPPSVNTTDIKKYFTKIWGKPVYTDSFPNKYRFDNGHIYGINYRRLYKGGEMFIEPSMEEAWEYSVMGLNVWSLQQAYLWFYTVEEQFMLKRHILPSRDYPIQAINSDNLKLIFTSDNELEIIRTDVTGFTEYVRFLYINGSMNIIWGGHI